MFKDLTTMIKVCAGCRLGYSNRKPPFDICLVHKETRIIKNPLNLKDMNVVVNAHYHVTPDSPVYSFLPMFTAV